MGILTRRDFVGGVAGITASAVVGASVARASEDMFDETYDVVVCGMGFAGLTAAKFASENGAKVLVVDRAPEGEAGGNSRVCGQLMLYSYDVDGCLTYLKAMQGEMAYDEDLLRVYAEGICNIPEVLTHFGITEPVKWRDLLANDPQTAKEAKIEFLSHVMDPEYPELPGADSMDCITAHAGVFDSFLFQTILPVVESEESITISFETPAIELIQDAESKKILGVTIERDGERRRVQARGGVVLATGGFECNEQMIQDHLGCSRVGYIGGAHNLGDGVRMAMAAGADLWHMTSYESGAVAGLSWAVPKGERASLCLGVTAIVPGATIIVAEDGTRYFNEVQTSRHGKVDFHGTFRPVNMSAHPWMIFDEGQMDKFQEKPSTLPEDQSIIISAETIEDLANKTGLPSENLKRTIDRFNDFAANGEDIECGRAPESMRPFEGTLYAIPMINVLLNTQGGPRRNAQAQVISVSGDPIPGLYSAGELGGCASFYYNGGGNVAECLTFGRIAGTNAAKAVK